MIIYKFGGVSVKDASGIKNVCSIIQEENDQLVVVVSAIGDTTNRLESIVDDLYGERSLLSERVQQLRHLHNGVVCDLWDEVPQELVVQMDKIFGELMAYLSKGPVDTYEYSYDQIIGTGELLSSKILSHFLYKKGSVNQWLDVRSCMRTDSNYGDANVNWEVSQSLLDGVFEGNTSSLFVTQGFIGSDDKGNTTSLGREGSDYTASILAHLLNASKMVIWKDVLGVLNADPDYFKETVKLDLIPYQEAIELSYYGARVIHPKTIKPLQASEIPLWVKSFLEPKAHGTLIAKGDQPNPLLPNFIVKKRQLLITLLPLNFSFIGENDLFFVFSLITKYRIKVNFSQNTAVSFAFCVNEADRNIGALVKELNGQFKVQEDCDLELITVRHYNEDTLKSISINQEVLIEQKNKNTAIFLVNSLHAHKDIALREVNILKDDLLVAGSGYSV